LTDLSGDATIYNAMFRNKHAIMLLLDPLAGQIIDVNPAACDFYGYSREQLLKMNIADIHTLTKEELITNMSTAVQEQSQHRYFQHRLANNEIRDVEVFLEKLELMGKPHLFAFVHDITKRKQAEDEMKQAYAELNQIFNTAVDFMRVVDKDFNIVRINRTLLNLLHLKEEEAIGKKCYDLLPGRFCHTSNCPLERIVKGEHRIEYEVDKDLNGKEIPFMVTATPFKNANGTLLGMVQNFRDITERKKYTESIKHLAYHDHLTGLPNRLMFNNIAKKSLDNVIVVGKKELMALLYFDLDGFKYINDNFGHSIGDKMLKKITERLKDTVSINESLSRLGGDEFALLITNVKDIEEVSQIAEDINKIFKDPFHIDGVELFVTASIGISLYPFDGLDVETLLKHADIAMYQAKKGTKNTYKYFSDKLKKDFSRRVLVEYHLRNALENDELSIHYQPKINIKSGMIEGMEALLRWENPVLGKVSPVEFIPIAEETGLIIPIGKWVLYQTCLQNKNWQEKGYLPMRLAVNLSGVQLQQHNFVEMVEEILVETGLSANFLELEITESIALENLEGHLKIIEQLKKKGISISLDDFGTGYSSLSYLKKLPIDCLKMDKSFINDICKDKTNEAIASAIITMAHHLKLQVTAEGVETEEQLSILKNYDCDHLQGYLFSRPLPANQIEQLFFFY